MNWRNDVVFCPSLPSRKDGGQNLDQATMAKFIAQDVLKSKCKGFEELVKLRYAQMEENFKDVSYTSSEWDLKEFNCKSIKTCADDKDARLQVPQNQVCTGCQCIAGLFDFPNFGHDLPIWYVRSGLAKMAKRVMIVSIEPARSDEKSGFITLSSPFGFHSDDYRVKTQRDNISRLVNLLGDAGCCIYMTDALKFYATEKMGVRKNIIQAQKEKRDAFREYFGRLLDYEISIFDPDLIIALGNDVVDKSKVVSLLSIPATLRAKNGCRVVLERKLLPAYHPKPQRLGRMNLCGATDLRGYFEKVAQSALDYLQLEYPGEVIKSS